MTETRHPDTTSRNNIPDARPFPNAPFRVRCAGCGVWESRYLVAITRCTDDYMCHDCIIKHERECNLCRS